MAEPIQPFHRVREILQCVLAVHMRWIRQCQVHAHGTDDHRQRAVLSYLCDTEKECVAAIHRYEVGETVVLETFVQGVPIAALKCAQAARGLDGRGDPFSGDARMELTDLLQEYRTRDQALQQLYEQLADAQLGPRAKRMFLDLAKLGRRNQARLQMALLDF